ncbi:MAG: prepilin-type N-terminal cleavage/methylation domain-containing protein [Arenimonas sp.]|uniref:prepilin-type N-terminal cleavage/methylation domain-containing protein n=1 Tax=Arenimonas sp. TaxID=1872635 RepID=UPI0025BB6926|nr:prepilin-type N-terminal cleavage/methylation domain-containing protein [Arenimonas sp.]MBW8368441.1 prepilin-type N-terminal cleavage/methylation domain-containing protein [Arenimonas sp.]
MKSRARARGFSLLEAVVALAILAAAGMALFAAMTQSVQMVGRAERARDADLALRNSLAWVDLVNPMDEPTGERDIGPYQLRWRAELLEPPRDGTTGYLQPGLYQIGLYRMELELWRDGTLEREAELNRAGFRQVRKRQVL